jgi:hypothetical protein
MTIEFAVAFVIGASLIVVILIWRKLRSMDARLSKMQKQLGELQKEIKDSHILFNRLFMTAMNANPTVEAAFLAEPQNTAAKSNGGEERQSQEASSEHQPHDRSIKRLPGVD